MFMAINSTVQKWYKPVLAVVLPLIPMLVTVSLWVDTRYMHKEISDIRYIDLQIRVIESQIKSYNRIKEAGGKMSVEEAWKYDMDIDQLKNLMAERNRVMGIGDTQ